MLEEKGRVVESVNGFASVQMQRRSSCSSCSAKKGCGVSVLEKFVGVKSANISALNRIGAKVGDDVVVAIKEDFLLKGSLAIYGLPIVAMIVGALLGDLISRHLLESGGDAMALVFGFGGLFIAVLWLRRYLSVVAENQQYQPVIVRRCSE